MAVSETGSAIDHQRPVRDAEHAAHCAVPIDQSSRGGEVGRRYDREWRVGQSFPLPPHPLSFAAKRLGAGARALGLGWQANSRAALSLPWNGRPPCNYCGACNNGCPIGDKGSADVTFIAAALATGKCTIRPQSPVIRIERGPDDRVAAVLAGRPDGSIERIASPHLVLACGAVESLLLASDGLGNESGEVGQNFIDTLFITVGALHPQPQHGRRGLPSDAISWDFNAPDAIPGVIGGCRFYNAAGEGELGGLAAFAMRAVPGWGRNHAESVRRLWGHALHVGAIGEMLPNPDSRVDLDPTARAASPQPRRTGSSFSSRRDGCAPCVAAYPSSHVTPFVIRGRRSAVASTR